MHNGHRTHQCWAFNILPFNTLQLFFVYTYFWFLCFHRVRIKARKIENFSAWRVRRELWEWAENYVAVACNFRTAATISITLSFLFSREEKPVLLEKAVLQQELAQHFDYPLISRHGQSDSTGSETASSAKRLFETWVLRRTAWIECALRYRALDASKVARNPFQIRTARSKAGLRRGALACLAII